MAVLCRQKRLERPPQPSAYYNPWDVYQSGSLRRDLSPAAAANGAAGVWPFSDGEVFERSGY